MLLLESLQAKLSWEYILSKRSQLHGHSKINKENMVRSNATYEALHMEIGI